jgi:hypothetical protein
MLETLDESLKTLGKDVTENAALWKEWYFKGDFLGQNQRGIQIS